MTESIGTAALHLTVDTRGIEVGVEKAQSKVAGFSNVVQAEYQKMNAAEKRRVDSLTRQTETLGLAKDELLKYNIVMKTQGAIQQELLAKVNATTAGMKKQGTQFNEFGRSEKQLTQAFRQVPAQLTDIFVGLQGGQNPLTVLIQQGGQLKDVFGGVVPAARALGSAVLGLINPVTLTIGAIAALIVVLKGVEDREVVLANALTLTGNAAQSSVSQLQDYARTIDETTLASERSASSVVAAVAQTGKFVGDQILLVATAAQQMQEATGREIGKTIAEFASLKDGPVDAILKLNAAIGDGTNVTHFLTEETLKQIQALRDQGDEAGATKLAMESYAAAINDRAPQISQNLDTIAGKWRSLQGSAVDAVDGVVNAVNGLLNAIGRIDQATNVAIKGFEKRLSDQGGVFAALAIAVDKFFADPKATNPSVRVAPGATSPIVDPQQQAAIKKFRDDGVRYLTEELKLKRDIAEAERVGTAAGLKGTQTLKDRIEAIKKDYAERAAKKGKSGAGAARSLANAEVKADMQAYKDALAVEQAAIQSGTQLLAANYAARNVSAEDYYDQQRGFLERGQQAEASALQGQIAILQQRSLKGKDAVDTVRQIAEMEAQLAKVRAEGSTKLALLTIQEQEHNEARTNSIEDYRDRLLESNVALQASTNAAIARIGLGSQEADQQERLNDIYAEQATALAELNKELRRGAIDQAQFDADASALQSATDQQVSIVTDGFRRMLEAQADWHNGFKQGLADWLAGTADVASQISGITNRALDSASDALSEFALTGKLEIKALLVSILTDIVKFLAQRAIMQFILAFLPGFSSAGTGSFTPSAGQVFPNALGNPFPGGTSLPTNSIVTQPTLFKFAKGGSFGLAGEAGKEAIMPLERGANGKLGVTMYGGGAAGNVTINVQTIVNADGSSDTKVTSDDKAMLFKEFSSHMERIAKKAVMDESRPGGSLHRAGVRVG